MDGQNDKIPHPSQPRNQPPRFCVSILKTVITGEVCARDTRNGVITHRPPECRELRNSII